MMKRFLVCLLVLSVMLACACTAPTPPPAIDPPAIDPPAEPTADPFDAAYTPVADPEKTVDFGTFQVNTEVQGGIVGAANRYLIQKGGEYMLRGEITDGQIIIDVPKTEKVKLILVGCHIRSTQTAPIRALSADEVTIKSEAGTYNAITDARPLSLIDEEDAAVYAKDDLSFSGRGTLVIRSENGKGIHCSNDVKIKNTTLKVEAADTAIKGNDSVSIESGTLLLISHAEDGIKTSHSDISSKDKQRGSVTFAGGRTEIYAYADGVQAAYNVICQPTATVSIYSGAYGVTDTAAGEYTGTGSAKGIKAENAVNIEGGTLVIVSTEDGIRANRGAALENGQTGHGTVSLTGGRVRVRTDDVAITAMSSLTLTAGLLTVEINEGGTDTLISPSVTHTDTDLLFLGESTFTVEGALRVELATPIAVGLHTVRADGTPVATFTANAGHTKLLLIGPSFSAEADLTLDEDALEPLAP